MRNVKFATSTVGKRGSDERPVLDDSKATVANGNVGAAR
jgi:hypothetical protein